MLVLAHRGASADAPENTLPAFQEAIAQQADGVELDAMVCGSGEVIVCHDPTLERLAGVPWRVATTAYAKLRTLDVGTHLGRGKAGIPLLEDVMAMLPAHVVLNIELKCDDLNDLGLARKVGELVTARGFEERVLISSFNPLCLVRLANAYPALRRGYLIDPDKPYWFHGGVVAPLLSTFSVHPPEQACTAEHMEGWRRAGLKVAAWTVDDVARAKELETLGVTYCITNHPRKIKEATRSGRPGTG